MRDYSKVSPKFWIGKTGKALRKQGPEAMIVGMYLMTAPTSNMLGLYYLSLGTIAHETGLGMQGASKGLQSAIQAGFCAYDEESEVVWVYEMASYQIAESLKESDLRVKGVQNEYDALPENPYLARFFEKYGTAFRMTNKRDAESPSEAPSKPLQSQEQEQEKEQEQEQKKTHVEQPRLDLAPYTPPVGGEVETIFDYWKQVMLTPGSVLDNKRRKLIKDALKLYPPADLCKAIRGCSKSPFHMGKNDRKRKFNGLHLILRGAEYIDMFIDLDRGDAATANETVEQRNARIAAMFLDEDLHDENTIEMETH